MKTPLRRQRKASVGVSLVCMGGKHLCVGREKADNSYFDANTLETPLRRQRKVAIAI